MQGTFACFLFLWFISFSAWLFAYYEFQSIALRQRSSLYAHNPLCLANKEKEMNNKEINSVFYTAKRHVDVPQALTWVMQVPRAPTQFLHKYLCGIFYLRNKYLLRYRIKAPLPWITLKQSGSKQEFYPCLLNIQNNYFGKY